MPRTVIVGDLHACTGELEELLEQLGFVVSVDRLVLVGDLVARGPDPRGAIALLQGLKARAVRGNHEDKLLAFRRRQEALGAEHARVASVLTEEDWRTLESLPLWLELPEHNATVVHAGVIPGKAIKNVPPEALMRMRTLDSRGKWSDDAEAGVLWGSRYEGPPHIVFGHNARPAPQLHPWATGLDTGCVYGGMLTAMVLDEGEPVPRGPHVKRLLRSVRAARKYYGGKGAMQSR